uniref:Uncharacterized protein n=1 Tax=Arundo donax TaxID=35708 RepID=A0A0A9F8M7_ARUDO
MNCGSAASSINCQFNSRPIVEGFAKIGGGSGDSIVQKWEQLGRIGEKHH